MSEDTKQRMPKIPEDPTNLPWNYPGMIVCEGRYYHSLFMITIPRGPGFPFGGDMNGNVWRYDNAPDEWIVTFRIRYNAAVNNSPWDYRDRKSWYAARMRCSEEEITNKTQSLTELISGMTGLFFKTRPSEVDSIIIRGDHNKFIDEVQRQRKPWMHMKSARE